jgi:uncharacterized protein YfaS (alpha-2-macroglobulin family)
VVFVGQSYAADSGNRGISILFSAPLAVNQSFSEAIQLTDADGQRINRDWLLSRNPRSLYISGLLAGQYHVYIASGLKDIHGKRLTTALQGKITIH